MSYRQFQPDPGLRPYIDAYWTIRTEKTVNKITRILPDGCIDIIYNAGRELRDLVEGLTFKNETAYLVGTMTRYIDTWSRDHTHLIGIRFKPLGFASFFKSFPLTEVTNRTIQFDLDSLPAMNECNEDTIRLLDRFFLSRLVDNVSAIRRVIGDITCSNGSVTVRSIARKYAVSSRQLERKFNQYVGLSPKEFISFVRYQFAYAQIKENAGIKSLSEIAFDTGYFDHSHLTNEIKKYSGFVPSEIQMSLFSKSGNDLR